MLDVAVTVALVWTLCLLGAAVLVLARGGGVLQRAIAADLVVLLLVAVLAELTYLRGEPYYLDAAVVLAALAFVSTVAVARFHARRRVF